MIQASYAVMYVVTDVTPQDVVTAEAYGIASEQFVGTAMPFAHDLHDHAFLWASGGSAIDLHPAGFRDSYGWGSAANQQVGYGYSYAAATDHALLWGGSPDTAVDLHPQGFLFSAAYGVSGNRQVGSGYSLIWSNEHALLWSGSADTATDIHPAGFTHSHAARISGRRIIGYASGADYMDHAILWPGEPGRFVDLNPEGFRLTQAFGIAGKNQGGLGYGPATGGYENHALLWAGTAESVVDLHPAGYVRSACWSISQKYQVGGIILLTPKGEEGHAAIWSGSASNFVDLHNLLPTNYDSSVGADVDADGVIVGNAYDGRTGRYHAIIWTPLPESVVICNEPGSCGAAWRFPSAPGTLWNPPSGTVFPVGTNVVTCTSTNPRQPFNGYTFTVTVRDCEAPTARSAAFKGNSDAPAEEHSNGAGIFQISATDNCDPNPQLFIRDSVTGYTSGPFQNGAVVQVIPGTGGQQSRSYKQADGRIAIARVFARAAVLYSVDAAGNVGSPVPCTGR